MFCFLECFDCDIILILVCCWGLDMDTRWVSGATIVLLSCMIFRWKTATQKAELDIVLNSRHLLHDKSAATGALRRNVAMGQNSCRTLMNSDLRLPKGGNPRKCLKCLVLTHSLLDWS